MKMRLKRWVLCVVICAAPPAFAACPPAAADGATLQAGPVQLAWRAEPLKISAGQPFSLQLQLCPASAVLTRVDATMPEHRHGMNYKLSLHKLGEGRWRVDGLLWHMAGRWELRFDVQHDGSTHTLRQDVVLR
jgi:hypothetical protein